MINFDDVVIENIKEHNPNWPQTPNHLHRILITGGSGSAKQNSLLNLINQQPDIHKIYLCAKDPYKAKYQFLINKRESTCSKRLNDSKAFIECSNDMDDIYKNIEEYNPNKRHKVVIVLLIWLLKIIIFSKVPNNKLHLIIHHMLTLKTLWIFIKI